jgi:hypothetical protein
LRSRPAIEIALDLQAMPSLAKTIRKRPLPPEVTALLRVAAGSPELAREFADKYRCSEDRIREACVFFLQQAALFPGADNYRMLGLDAGAPAPQVREHRRWLLMWLHPDRNQDKWESALFEKVVAAAKAIDSGAVIARPAVPARKRKHRRAPSLRPVQRPAVQRPAHARPKLAIKPLVLLFAAIAFLLSVGAILGALAVGAGEPTREGMHSNISRSLDVTGLPCAAYR